MVMRMLRVVLLLTLPALAVVTSTHAAGADCAGPTITHASGSVDRDGTIHLVGTYWGDNCYDTGPPPEGEGTLGEPATGIKIFLKQGEVEHLVATGNADEDYGFTIDAPVPDDLNPGPVEVVARSAADITPLIATTEPVVISDVAPSGSSSDEPVSFNSDDTSMTTVETTVATATSPEATSSSGKTNSTGISPVPFVLAGAISLIAALFAVRAFRSRS